HRAPPADEPQLALSRRRAAASLLPAGAQARGASRGAGRSGDLGQSEVLPRHRQRTARAQRQGGRVRLRRHVHRARCNRALCGRVRGGRQARQARRLREPVRRAVLRPAAEPRAGHARARGLAGAGVAAVRAGRGIDSAACRGDDSLEAGLEHPIYDSVRHWLARAAAAGWPSLDALNALADEAQVRTASGKPLRFVPPSAADPYYEIHLHETGCVATRERNWHDLFNALAWLAFPRTKAMINALHAREIPREGGRRGRLRDMLTICDEGGAIVRCDDPELLRLIAEFRWKELFWEQRG